MTKKVPILGTSVSPDLPESEYFAGGKWRLLTKNNQLSYGHLPSNRLRRKINSRDNANSRLCALWAMEGKSRHLSDTSHWSNGRNFH